MWSLKYCPVVNMPNSHCTLLGATVGRCKPSFITIVPLKSHRFYTDNHLNNYLYGLVP